MGLQKKLGRYRRNRQRKIRRLAWQAIFNPRSKPVERSTDNAAFITIGERSTETPVEEQD